MDIHDLDEEQVSRLGAFDLKRAGQVVHLGKVHVAHIVSGIVVSDLAPSPVDGVRDPA